MLATREQIERARKQPLPDRSAFDVAVDYLDGRMIADVTAELTACFPSAMSGEVDQQMRPFVVPLVERYVAESASLYNRKVTRRLVNATGEVNEAATTDLEKALRAINFDETMHAVCRHTVLLRSCVVWFQVKRGQLRPVVHMPQRTVPVPLPAEVNPHVDRADQDDYAGFALELAQPMGEEAGSFAYVTPEATHFYSGRDISDTMGADEYANPWRWPQAQDTRDGRLSLVDAPLQPIVIFQFPKPNGTLFPVHDVDLARTNREINVFLSSLLDTVRFQSYATPWYQTLNNEPPSATPHGVRFPRTLRAGETFGYAEAGVRYTELVGVLQSVVRLAAVARRQSPNDFAIDGSRGPESGFAKLVDSLPKIEARGELEARFKDIEQTRVWPRLGAMLTYLGTLDKSARALSMVVEYSPVSVPRTADERVKEEEHDIRLGLTTPAQILAKKLGISVDEAEQQIAKNKEGAPAAQPQQEQAQQPQRQGFADRLRARIAERGG